MLKTDSCKLKVSSLIRKIMVRIQLDLPDEQVKELDELMKETKLTTRKDLFNNALTLFQWAAKAKNLGRIVASIDEENGNARELVMPAPENVKSHLHLVTAGQIKAR